MMDLHVRFKQLLMPFTEEPLTRWTQLALAHNEKGRFYHNLTHLENLFVELEAVRDQIEDWDTVSFSVFYHDAVYKVRKQDNEERSADLAVKVLKEITYPIDKIERCRAQIIATKSHNILVDRDANLFTDADLSILGKEWEIYETYINNIRKEYKIYPNVLYKTGRKKVLNHFLDMEHIFKTTYFRDKYEIQARNNIRKELEIY